MDCLETATSDDGTANVQTDRKAWTPPPATTLIAKTSDIDAVSSSFDPLRSRHQEGDSDEIAINRTYPVVLIETIVLHEKKDGVTRNSGHCPSEGTHDLAGSIREKTPVPEDEPFSAAAGQPTATKLDSFHHGGEVSVSAEVVEVASAPEGDTDLGVVGGASDLATPKSPTDNTGNSEQERVFDDLTDDPPQQSASAQVAVVNGELHSTSNPVTPDAAAALLEDGPLLRLPHLSPAILHPDPRKDYLPDVPPQRPRGPESVRFIEELQQDLVRWYGREIPIDASFTDDTLLAARDFLANTVKRRTRLPPAFLFKQLAPRVVALAMSLSRGTQSGVWPDHVIVTDEYIKRAVALIDGDGTNYQGIVRPFIPTSYDQPEQYECPQCNVSFHRSKKHALIFLAKSDDFSLASIDDDGFLVDLRCVRCRRRRLVATLRFTHVERARFFLSLHEDGPPVASRRALAGHVR